MTDPVFLGERDEFRRLWLSVPPGGRPGLPLSRTAVPAPAEDRAAAFQGRLDGFCDRHGLLGMTT